MPRGQKSKFSACGRRRQTLRQKPRSQAFGAEVKETLSASSEVVEAFSSSTAASMAPKSKEDPSVRSGADAVGLKLDDSAMSKRKIGVRRSQRALFTLGAQRDPFIRKVGLVMNYLLEKYKMKEPVLKKDMLKIAARKYRSHLSMILKKVSQYLEPVFGLILKEIQPGVSYSIVSQLDLSNDGSDSSGSRFPKNGLLMLVLGVIFINGNCISETEIWKVMNVLGVFEGTIHLIFGDVRKLLTQDWVKEQYLEHLQVPNSDPPSFAFLWGQRARAKVSKMKVLKYLAKYNGTCPTTFSEHYEEALKEEKERAANSITTVVLMRFSHQCK